MTMQEDMGVTEIDGGMVEVEEEASVRTTGSGSQKMRETTTGFEIARHQNNILTASMNLFYL